MTNTTQPQTDTSQSGADQQMKEAYFTASQGQLIWARFKKQKAAMAGAWVLFILILSGIFAPFLTPYSPTLAGRDKDYQNGAPQLPKFWDENGFSARPFIYSYKRERSFATNFRWVSTIDRKERRYLTLLPAGEKYSLFWLDFDRHLFGVDKGKVHIFGTDSTGKDIFSRTLHAINTSLAVGTIGVAIAFVLALIIGGIAGYYGGWIDSVIQMVTDAIRTIPAIPLFMAIAAFIPSEWSSEARFFFISIILGFINWPTLARRVRTHLLTERNQEYVLAAQLSGASPNHIIRKHLLPSFTSYIIVDLVISFPYMVLSETALSFIGLGLRDPSEFAGCDVAKRYQCRCAFELSVVFHTCVLFHHSGSGICLCGRWSARCSRPIWGYQIMTLLSVENLTIQFDTDEGRILAVDDVSFQVNAGEILGIVGESGSGKSITAKAIMHLNARNTVYGEDASIKLALEDGVVDVFSLKEGIAMQVVRGGAVSMIFQEPMASFAPAITIGAQMVEQLMLHKNISKKEAVNLSVEMLERVGISDASTRFKQYAFELSGGMRQRAMIAMALSTSPKLLIADEPTTALDVTIQAQVIDLMKDLVKEYGMGIIFITHDLGVIAQTADRVAVMYLGNIVEQGPVRDVIRAPSHPYTRGLLEALPRLDDLDAPLMPVPGDIPSPLERPSGCAFHTRCSLAEPRCSQSAPKMKTFADGHTGACFVEADKRGAL